MAARRLPPCQDIPRTIGSTVESTVDGMLQLWERPAANWSYVPVIGASAFIITHAWSDDVAAEKVEKTGSPSGRPHNATVARLLYSHFEKLEITAYPIKRKTLELDKQNGLQTIVRPAAVLATPDVTRVLVHQPRKNFLIEADDWALWKWMVKRSLSTGDLAGCAVDFFDTSAGSNGDRDVRYIRDEDIKEIDPELALSRLKIFVDAYHIASKIAPPPKRRPKDEDVGKPLPLFDGI